MIWYLFSVFWRNWCHNCTCLHWNICSYIIGTGTIFYFIGIHLLAEAKHVWIFVITMHTVHEKIVSNSHLENFKSISHWKHFNAKRFSSDFYTPASTKLIGGYTGITLSICPSVHLWTESCPLCIFNNTHRIHFIFAHLIKQLQKVCPL